MSISWLSRLLHVVMLLVPPFLTNCVLFLLLVLVDQAPVAVPDRRTTFFPPLTGTQKHALGKPPTLVLAPSFICTATVCNSSTLFSQHRPMFKVFRSHIASFKVAEMGCLVELDRYGSITVLPKVTLTNAEWCLVLEFRPQCSNIKAFSFFLSNRRTQVALTSSSLHRALKRGLMMADLKMKTVVPVSLSRCPTVVRADLIAGPRQTWTIGVMMPHGSVTSVKVSRMCKGRSLWLKLIEIARTGNHCTEDTLNIDSLFKGNRYDCPLPICCLGLHDDCVVDVVAENDPEWTVFVKGPDGSVTAIPVSKDEDCSKFHQRVAHMMTNQLPVSPSDIYTSHGSKLLEHTNAKVWETGMHNGSTVMANIRIRGGICVPFSGNLKRKKNQVSRN